MTKKELAEIIKEELIGEEVWNNNMNMNDDEINNLSFDIAVKILEKYINLNNNYENRFNTQSYE
tara:strand:- start:4531 stop:4722 length:192 start_codon:yes stop_codon:yes gene_type:complete